MGFSVRHYLVTGHGELFGHDTAPLRLRMFPQSSVFQKTDRPALVAALGPTPGQVPEHLQVPAPPPQRSPLATSTVEPCVLPPQPSTALAADCEQLLQAAWRHADRGKLDVAAQDCRRAIAMAAFDPRPYYLLAQLAQERGDAMEAKTMLNKVIYLDPDAIAAYLDLAALQQESGERARRTYETARTALQKLPAATVLAPYSESTAADVLAYLERRLGRSVRAAPLKTGAGAQLHQSA